MRSLEFGGRAALYVRNAPQCPDLRISPLTPANPLVHSLVFLRSVVTWRLLTFANATEKPRNLRFSSYIDEMSGPDVTLPCTILTPNFSRYGSTEPKSPALVGLSSLGSIVLIWFWTLVASICYVIRFCSSRSGVVRLMNCEWQFDRAPRTIDKIGGYNMSRLQIFVQLWDISVYQEIQNAYNVQNYKECTKQSTYVI